MDNCIKISDFAKLTKSTLKTVMYYHKIGLLQEPKRSTNGYRLYGAEDLTRMRMIKELKSLGLDLKQIKEILGDVQNHRTIKQVLQSLHVGLLNEKKDIENQILKVEKLLNEEVVSLNEDLFESDSFQIITEILKPEQIKEYKQICPELYEQQSKIFGIIEAFQWGEDYKNNFKSIAEYFNEHPKQYKEALDFGKRLTELSQLTENDPEIDNLAREEAEFIKNVPFLKEMLYDKSGFGKLNESIYNDKIKEILSPAHLKHKQLIQKYLDYRP
jgi:DNA-binding transcriptional MerR regulator